jgi:uncharacterized membrane protein
MKPTRQILIGIVLISALLLAVSSLMLAGSAQAAIFPSTTTPAPTQAAALAPAQPQAPEVVQAPLAAGGPDAFGYTYQDSNEPGGPIYAWDEISGTGTLVSGWTNGNSGGAGPLPIGFDFPFYGNTYVEVYPNTAGYVSFGQRYEMTQYSNLPSPSQPNNDISAFGGWDISLSAPGSGVYYQTLMNPQRFVIEFVNLSYYGNCPITLQMVLYPNGDSENRYRSIGCPRGGYAGIENIDGSVGLGLGYYYPTASSAIRYRYPRILTLQPVTQNGYARSGESAVYTVTVENRTQQTDRFNLTLQPGYSWATTLPFTQTGLLANGESVTFSVRVDVPLSAIPGNLDQVTLLARSVLSPTQYAVTATLHTLATSGEYGYVALSSKHIGVFDLVGETFVGAIDLQAVDCAVNKVSIPPDGKTLWVGCTNGIVVLDRQTHQIIRKIALSRTPSGIAFTQGGKYALMGSWQSSGVSVIDTNSYTITHQIPTSNSIASITVHPYLPVAYLTNAHDSKYIDIINLNTLSLDGKIFINTRSHMAVISRDGKRLFVGSQFFFEGISIVDLENQQLLYQHASGDPLGLDVTPDGSKIFVALPYGQIRAVNAQNGQIAGYSTTGPGFSYPMDVAFTCSGEKLFASNGGTFYGYMAQQQLAIIDPTTYSITKRLSAPDLNQDGYPEAAGDLVICPQYTALGVIQHPDSFDARGTRGETKVYTGTIVNATGVTTAFTLNKGASAWQSNISAVTSGPVTPWGQITYTVMVTVSPTAKWYSQDTLIVTATSVASPTLTAQATFTTEAYHPADIHTFPAGFSSNLVVGQIATHTLTVSNAEGVTLTYGISSAVHTADMVVDHFPAGRVFTTTTDNENNDHLGVPDDDMDHYTKWEDYNQPIEFNIFVDGEIGQTGNYLGLYVYDNVPMEVNHVHLNGVDLGILSPGTGIWNESIFELPAGLVKPGKNLVQVYPGMYGYWQSGIWLDWGRLYISNPAAPWVRTTPASGALTNSTSQPVTITFNSMGIQPGLHKAYIEIHSNDHNQPWVHIPVTMTLAPTDSMGWVEGTVTDILNGAPLTATLKAMGQPYTIHTNPATGAYKLWLEPGQYALQVTANGYVTETAAITIVSKAGSAQAFNLVRDIPHLVVTPASLSVPVSVGSIATYSLQIANEGPHPLTYRLSEFQETLPLRILSWRGCFNEDYETGDYQYLLRNATKPYIIDETKSNDPLVLAELLKTHDVLLLSMQTNDCVWDKIGASWGTTLEKYVSNGGSIVAIDSLLARDYPTIGSIVNAAGLLKNSYGWSRFTNPYFKVVTPQHPIVRGIPPIFQSGETNYNGSFRAYTGQVVVKSASDDGAVVAVRDIGSGFVALMNFSTFNQYNGKIVANAIEWHQNVPWLTEIPNIGTVAAHSSQPVSVAFDSRGFPPGAYTATVFVESNDPINSVIAVPITMTVVIPANAGRVSGIVRDAWSNAPVTATVDLADAYAVQSSPAYEIWALPGSYTLTISAPGYYTTTQAVNITSAGALVRDIALERNQPHLGSNLTAGITLTITAGQSASYTLPIQNQGPQALDIQLFESTPENHQILAPQTGTLAGKRILYDRAHGQGNLISWVSWGTLVSDLTVAGAIVQESDIISITSATLMNYDILIVASGSISWTVQELNALQIWLNNGGAVLVYGWANNSILGPASLYNITFHTTTGGWYVGYAQSIYHHPITRNVNRFYMDWGTDVPSLGLGKAFMTNVYGEVYGVAVNHNGGKMVVIPNSDFSDWRLSQYPGNRTLALNTFEWLSQPGYINIPWLTHSPVSATIPAHSSLDVTLGLDARNLAPGTYTGMLVVEHNDPAQDYAYIPLTMTVSAIPQPALSLTPETQQKQAYAGETVVYTLTVTNQGNATDTFTLQANGAWPTTLSATTSGPLASGASFTFTVSVQIPAGAAVNAEQSITVVATSSLLPTLNDSALLTTRVTAKPPTGYKVYLPMLVKP